VQEHAEQRDRSTGGALGVIEVGVAQASRAGGIDRRGKADRAGERIA